LDELGRHTDGVAIAVATMDHPIYKIRSCYLFVAQYQDACSLAFDLTPSYHLFSITSSFWNSSRLLTTASPKSFVVLDELGQGRVATEL
jgi:DNA mismatch repair ATPase MutS